MALTNVLKESQYKTIEDVLIRIPQEAVKFLKKTALK